MSHPDHTLALEGEVLRHLANKTSAEELKQKHAFAVEALQFEARRIGVDLPAVEDVNPRWDEVMAMIEAMLSVDRPTADFNFTLTGFVMWPTRRWNMTVFWNWRTSPKPCPGL